MSAQELSCAVVLGQPARDIEEDRYDSTTGWTRLGGGVYLSEPVGAGRKTEPPIVGEPGQGSERAHVVEPAR